MKIILLKILFLTLLFSSGCSLIFTKPEELSTVRRDAMFPTKNLSFSDSVDIYWNENRIPFIHARNDSDIAYAIGLVHAHLRLNQLEVFKMASQGRLSELAGPIALKIDKTIRIFNFGRAVPEIIASMPDETKIWAHNFLNGLNDYIRNMEKRPPELRALGIEPQPWTMEDLITLMRLAAIDVNWIYYISFLMMQDVEGWEQVWEHNLERGMISIPSFKYSNLLDSPAPIPAYFSKSGSNSVVIADKKTNHGAAMIANDPHLGIQIPNTWLLIGYKSPSYHLVGFSIPGIPFIALGRNENISWGGTNMWALSTYLYRLSEDDVRDAETGISKIEVRGWFDSEIKTRFTKWGPIISDSPLIESDQPLAMKWVGHEKSDELTAFLKMNKAGNWNEFRNAFGTYAVSAQNMLYADKYGNIGHVLAFRQPIRADNSQISLFNSKENNFIQYKTPLELPFAYNPEEGFIASANNRPFDPDQQIGWFFAANDRIIRIKQLISEKDIIDMQDLIDLQLDVYSETSHEFAGLIVKKVNTKEIQDNTGKDIIKQLDQWDGYYKTEYKNPVAFELVYFKLFEQIIGKRYGEELVDYMQRSSHSRNTLYDIIAEMDNTEFLKQYKQAVAEIKDPYHDFKNWGEMHRMPIGNLLSNIPLLGRRWKLREFPAAGGSETLNKTAFQPSAEQNRVSYGANARHISDMSDMDENYFVLLGGQDGWLTSPQTLDQIELWRKGKYIKFPLRLSSIKSEFKYVMTLVPDKN